jgi:hypothetical protein
VALTFYSALTLGSDSHGSAATKSAAITILCVLVIPFGSSPVVADTRASHGAQGVCVCVPVTAGIATFICLTRGGLSGVAIAVDVMAMMKELLFVW